MLNYYAVSGQSLPDICLNTYGSMDYFYKLLQDSGIADGNQLPYTGQLFVYDPTVIVDLSVKNTTTLNNIRYATANAGNGNTYYIVTGGTGTPKPNNPPPQPPTIFNMYEKVSALNYTSISDAGETSIVIPTLTGKTIVQIEKNIQPLKASEWSFSQTTATITLIEPIFKDETLFIIYKEMITI